MTEAAKTNVCLVGVGLIGGSLGLALRAKGKKRYTVTGLGRHPRKLATAMRMGAIDRFETNAKAAVQSADIIVLCVPVHLIANQLAKLAPWIKRGAIVTDVGSVKKTVLRQARHALRGRRDVHFVGGHPIAGSEKTGVKNAVATLFQKAVCVITSDGAPRTARQTIRTLWETTGARCLELSAAKHDHWLALTSHLPHLLAFSLFQCVSDAATTHPVLKSLVGGSFRDMTRIAGSDPDLWGGILETNRREIQKAVRLASQHLLLLGRSPLPKLIPALRRLQRAKAKWSTSR